MAIVNSIAGAFCFKGHDSIYRSDIWITKFDEPNEEEMKVYHHSSEKAYYNFGMNFLNLLTEMVYDAFSQLVGRLQ